MKKQCESTLNKIQIETSATIGMASSMVGGTVRFVGGVASGILAPLDGENFVEGYEKFNKELIDPGMEMLKDSVPDKEAYDIGYVAGIIIPIVGSAYNIVNSAGQIIKTIKSAETIPQIIGIASDGTAIAGRSLSISNTTAGEIINNLFQASMGIGSAGTSGSNMIGEKGTQTSSKTIWQNGKTERIDVENPNPGQRPGQIHYQDENNVKWLYDIENKKFVNPKTHELAPSKIQRLLERDDIQKAISKGLKYLGE